MSPTNWFVRTAVQKLKTSSTSLQSSKESSNSSCPKLEMLESRGSTGFCSISKSCSICSMQCLKTQTCSALHGRHKLSSCHSSQPSGANAGPPARILYPRPRIAPSQGSGISTLTGLPEALLSLEGLINLREVMLRK